MRKKTERQPEYSPQAQCLGGRCLFTKYRSKAYDSEGYNVIQENDQQRTPPYLLGIAGHKKRRNGLHAGQHLKNAVYTSRSQAPISVRSLYAMMTMGSMLAV